MNIIQAKNLIKSFKNGTNELIVLKDLSFDIQESQFLAIVGRSGSGKSTLLYQLGLLDRPTSGEVTIEGVETSNLKNEERTKFRLKNLGYIFQDYALLPMLTAIENVSMPLLMQGFSQKEAYAKSTEALRRVGLDDKLTNLPSQLSGGQQQRVSIARAIAHSPKIVFADEPTANLDTESSQMILDVFLDLNKNGQTIIMVTHEEEYASMAHRVIRLLDGKIVEDKKHS